MNCRQRNRANRLHKEISISTKLKLNQLGLLVLASHCRQELTTEVWLDQIFGCTSIGFTSTDMRAGEIVSTEGLDLLAFALPPSSSDHNDLLIHVV